MNFFSKKKSIVLAGLFLVALFLFFGAVNIKKAEAQSSVFEALGTSHIGIPMTTSAIEKSCAKAAELIKGACIPVPGVGFDCTPAILASMEAAGVLTNCENLTVTAENKIKILSDKAIEIGKQTWLDNLAGAWKAMLSQFSKQMAYDTATWIASGGKGQKPLFVTEGWGAYIKNTADESFGAFIDKIDERYHLDLCEPNFNVKIAIMTSLDWRKPKKPDCSFSKMAGNWRNAVNDANFAIDYNNYLMPGAGANDISAFLILQTGVLDETAFGKQMAIVDLLAGSGWKNLESFTKKILTPGTMVRNQWEVSQFWAGKSESTFTGTIWDFIETFLNTLVGQLLERLKTGFFDENGDSNNPSFNLPVFSPLFNPESSPGSEGVQGAKQRFSKLVQGDFKVGGPYNILTKLTQCSDSAKSNLGPTDCVMDQILADKIREKKLLKDAGDILNRKFAPKNFGPEDYQNSFTLRNVTILRKYRIVPVGWEIAARYITNYGDRAYTLGDIMKDFSNVNSPFYQLIDPYWVLKAPELFCRREGYGPQNTFANEQSGTVLRAKYCADEQQCIKEDSKGNCSAYGYCAEEKRIWNFSGQACQATFNTCTTFQAKSGSQVSYLANTLDYRDCNAGNAGCQWYSQSFNPVDASWTHLTDSPEKVLATSTSGAVVSGERVAQWRSISPNNKVIMASPCAKSEGCDFSGVSCRIPAGGAKCRIDNCLDTANILAGLNGNFETQDSSVWNAKNWEEAYQDSNNGHSRVAGQGQANSFALETRSLSNSAEIITILPKVKVDVNQRYSLQFYFRGNLGQGTVTVEVDTDEANLGGVNIFGSSVAGIWQSRTIEFNSGGKTEVDIKIITRSGSNGAVYFDDFGLKKIKSDCDQNTVWLTAGAKAETSQEIYFDRDVQACDQKSEGCSQFIRLKAGLGSNLLYDGGFEEEYSNVANWQGEGGNNVGCKIDSSSDNVAGGSKSIKVTGPTGASLSDYCVYSAKSQMDLVELQTNHKYVLSGMIFAEKAGTYYFDLREDQTITTESKLFGDNAAPLGQWIQVSKSFTWVKNDQIVTPRLVLKQNGTAGQGVYFDNLKIEEAAYYFDSPSAYSGYKPSERPAEQLAFIKKAPSYYSCYGDGNWTDNSETNRNKLLGILQNQSTACANYAGVCRPEEAGCEMYSPLSKDPGVPGVVTRVDVCPAECVGYQNYKQEPTYFTSAKYTQFIADNSAKYCSANAAGCDEFTNLDEVAKGGEGKEYFVNIRACQKSGNDDMSYYTWEGSDTTGYQLKVFKLKKSNLADNAPCTNLRYDQNGQNTCSDPVLAQNTGVCEKSDMAGNPDCREFYDALGGISYRLLSRTISISDDCHAYRRTQTQASLAVAATDCEVSGGYFNPQNECVYMAIPGEGATCSASMAGCRSYTGNRGNNVKNIVNSNFENGADNWQGGTIRSEATYPSGKSFANTGSVRKLSRAVTIKNNKAYTLSFWAKGDANFELNAVKFAGSPASDLFADKGNSFNAAIIQEWRRYDLGPVFVSWGASDEFSDTLEINLPAGQTLYIDNVILKEVQQNVYAIENSWFTPLACDNLIDTPYGTGDSQANATREAPGEMLGCEAYKDRANQIWNLKSFENLCRDKAVGCEAMIDTFNSDSPREVKYNSGDKAEVIAPADQVVYLVNDAKYNCAKDNLGCSAFGLPQLTNYDEATRFSTVYLKNQPDRYNTDLCKFSELWCNEYAGNRAVYYFKDPKNKICEYKEISAGEGFGWYQKSTSAPCSATTTQTIGTGVVSEKLQPVGWFDNQTGKANPGYEGWAGACPAEQSTCEEFVDPLPNIYTNNIFNGDFEQDVNDDKRPDGWEIRANSDFVDALDNNYVKYAVQSINLQTDTLYTISAQGKGEFSIQVSCGLGGANVKMWSPDLSMITADNTASMNRIVSGSDAQFGSGRFYVVPARNQQSSCRVLVFSNSFIDDVRLTESGVYYYLASSGLDRTSCGGQANFDTGCILFNERGEMDYGQSDAIKRASGYLSFDADKTYSQQAGNPGQSVSPQTSNVVGQKNANTILKVLPDRSCYSWLYCTTYEKADAKDANSAFGNNDRCLDLGLCLSFNSKGECNRFAVNSVQPVETNYSAKDANKSGYAMVGKKKIEGNRSVTSFYPFQQMTQYGGYANIPNGNFESVISGTSNPLGWIEPSDDRLRVDIKGWKDYKFSIEADAKNRRQDYGYLRLNSSYMAVSEEIEVKPGEKYILSGWINTLDLKPAEALGEIQLQQIRNDSSLVDFSSELGTPSTEEFWFWNSGLMIGSGRPWTRVTYEFTTKEKVYGVKIMVRNWAPGTNECLGVPKEGVTKPECPLRGFALYDDISLAPVLKVNNQDFTTRSCRIYPAQDGLSCKYSKDNKIYVGLSGYCLVADPQNENICLQWWPVDQIMGEVADEIGGNYDDRTPLFYCLESKVQRVEASAGGMLFRLGGGLSEIGGDIASALTGVAGAIGTDDDKFIPMILTNENARILFRYPFINDGNSFWFFGGFVGAVLGDPPVTAYPLIARMEKNEAWFLGVLPVGVINEVFDTVAGIFDNIDNLFNPNVNDVVKPTPANLGGSGSGDVAVKGGLKKNDEWGGWGVISTIGTEGIPITFAPPVPWSMVEPTIMGGGASAVTSGLGAIMDLIKNFLGGIYLDGSTFGVKIVTDEDTKYAGNFKDTIPSLKGDILGIAWGLNLGGLTLGGGVLGTTVGSVDLRWCTKVAQVVTSSGRNKAWQSRIAKGSLYNLPFDDGFDYYDLASSKNDKTLGIEFKGYAADYAPYGAAVAPANNMQDPMSWDSREQDNNFSLQPLYWEPPNLGMQAPYQARMGQVYWTGDSKADAKANNDKQKVNVRSLFAKTFGVWEWKGDDKEGQYEWKSETNDGGWNLPANYCKQNPTQIGFNANDPANFIRPIVTKPATTQGASGEICLVPPKIDKIKMNENDSATVFDGDTIKLTFNVKVDQDQLPITSYGVDWGDGTTPTVVSGVGLRDRTDINNTFTLYHSYSYWNLLQRFNAGALPFGSCSGSDNCTLRIKIDVRDNWRAENSALSGEIIVKEK